MRNLTADYMCSSDCPCPANETFSKWTEDLLNKNNRTKSSISRIVDGNRVYPLYTGPNIYNNRTYSTFWSCYEYVKNLTDNNAKLKQIENVTDGMKELVTAMENEFNCMGICTPGAFFFFKDLSQGPPTQNCLVGLKDVFKDKPLAIGILLLISFFFTVFAFFTSYGLCYSKEKKH
jgi:hypothetical protein